MTESRDARPMSDGPSDGQMRGSREWEAPTITVLGDVRTMTEAGGVNIPDGGGNNRS